MTILRFVHAADLHLDSPFRGIRNEAPSHVEGALSNATFDAYRNIIDLCLREQVAALLVAGDIYDGANRSLRAQLHFADGLARLEKAASGPSSATATTTLWTAGRPAWPCRRDASGSGRRSMASQCSQTSRNGRRSTG